MDFAIGNILLFKSGFIIRTFLINARVVVMDRVAGYAVRGVRCETRLRGSDSRLGTSDWSAFRRATRNAQPGTKHQPPVTGHQEQVTSTA